MAQFNFNDYEKMQAQRIEGDQSKTPRVSYFNLKTDGEEAIVRFIYNKPEEFDLISVHMVEIDGKQRRVNCLRTPYEPLDKCPLCSSGAKVYQKFFIKLIEYVTDENGKIIAVPRIWERPAMFARTLKTYFDNYGNLSDHIFKIKRHGERGNMQTTYDILYANPAVYKPNLYIKDFSGFENYSLFNYVVLDKSGDDLDTFVKTGVFPVTDVPQTPQPEPSQVQTPIQVQSPVNATSQPQSTTVGTDPSASRPRRYTY